MAKQKTARKKVGTLSMLLDFVDMADATVETITGKNIAAWLKDIQEQGKVDQGASPSQLLTGSANSYTILGLPDNASVGQVKRRYRQLAGIFHPDREGGYIEAMKRINEAYEEILKQKGAKP